MTSLINGTVADSLAIADRAIQYGDGLFETIAVINQQIHNWDKHFERLCNGCQVLGFSAPDEKKLLSEIESLLTQQPDMKRCIIKILLTRGTGGRGYGIPESQQNQRIITVYPWPDYPLEYYDQGVAIAEVSFRLAQQPVLSGIKHTNRLEQVLAKQKLSKEFQEALVLDHRDNIIEGISSNIYFFSDGVLCMPDLKQCGIAGTIRARIIELCQQNNILTKLGEFKIKQIREADEVFMSNSIIGLWPVKTIQLLDNETIQLSSPGPIYIRLATVINGQLKHF